MASNRITIVYNSSVHVVKSRLKLIAALQAQGYHVTVLSPVDEATPKLQEAGIAHIPISMNQYGMNPLAELRSMRQITDILRTIKPLVSLHYTIKPNLFGTLAAKRAGVPVINNIAGAGRLFSDTSAFIAKPIFLLLKRAFQHSTRVFFQNDDDKREFLELGLVGEARTLRIPGSGVDLQDFPQTPVPTERLEFLFAGRLLRAKGVEEFIKAAKEISRIHPEAQFRILGEHDPSDASYVDISDLEAFGRGPNNHFTGAVQPTEVAGFLERCTAFVLPSYYREGVPRVLLEAIASGRPIITTDNVGCREVVDDGVNGFRVPVRDPSALAQALDRFARLPAEARQDMADAARAKAEHVFDESIVIHRYLDAISMIWEQNARDMAG